LTAPTMWTSPTRAVAALRAAAHADAEDLPRARVVGPLAAGFQPGSSGSSPSPSRRSRPCASASAWRGGRVSTIRTTSPDLRLRLRSSWTCSRVERRHDLVVLGIAACRIDADRDRLVHRGRGRRSRGVSLRRPSILTGLSASRTCSLRSLGRAAFLSGLGAPGCSFPWEPRRAQSGAISSNDRRPRPAASSTGGAFGDRPRRPSSHAERAPALAAGSSAGRSSASARPQRPAAASSATGPPRPSWARRALGRLGRLLAHGCSVGLSGRPRAPRPARPAWVLSSGHHARFLRGKHAGAASVSKQPRDLLLDQTQPGGVLEALPWRAGNAG